MVSDIRVVGIGASAGGIEAITHLLDFLPNNTGMAFVFIQHLSPNHDSSLPVILEKHTRMAVTQVRKATLVKANQIYVIDPGTNLTLEEQILVPVPAPASAKHHAGWTIDVFFTSLAKAQQERAIGIILSGANTDGTNGIKAIKAGGGIVYAQTPKSAKFDTTLHSAIATALVDYIFTPDEIGRQLGQLRSTATLVEKLPNEATYWTELLNKLKHSSGIDFKEYKRLTVSRRVLRRMGLTNNFTLQEYMEFVKKEPSEIINLERDLFINYTKFFRDEKVFETIQTKIFPELFCNRLMSDTIRLWIPGCSTGEEVYSVAIILSEFMTSNDLTNPVLIFGSDADDEAVEQARSGIYPKSVSEAVSSARLNKFFLKTDTGYKLTNEIRSKCVFSKQNLVSDPPFSRIDFISCRNVMIYFESRLQKQALLRFHYALKPDGFLVLGMSESASDFSDYFEAITKLDKIYRKKSLSPNIRTSLFEPFTFTIRGNVNQTGGKVMNKESQLESIVEKEVLDRHGPVGVVVDNNLEIVRFRGQTSEFLSLPSGKPSLNLLRMIREDLSLDLFYALQQAKLINALVKTPRIPIGKDGNMVSIEVSPIHDDNAAETHLLILFNKINAAASETTLVSPETPTPEPNSWNKQREELAATRDYMKSVIVQYESNNEKLRTANEEAQTSNEELQTMNEELETAREELQSTNEELITLNEELQSRNEDLCNVNSDIQNVLRSITTSVLMLDGAMRIRRFNPGAEKLFNLIQTDIGRPIDNLQHNLKLNGFGKKVKKSVNELTIVEEEVVSDEGRWYLMKIRPYRSINDRIDGAVILFTDITSLRQSLDASRQALVLSAGIIETMSDPLVILQADLRIKSANQAFFRTIKSSAAEMTNKYIYELNTAPWNSLALQDLLHDVTANNVEVSDHKLDWESPETGQCTMLVNIHHIVEEGAETSLISMIAREIPIKNDSLTDGRLHDGADNAR
jgi:two-component system CheB/CheR fusion protein